MMIKFFYKFKYLYIFLYPLILYSFFVTLSLKENFLKRSSSFDKNQKQFTMPISIVEEKKFLLDFKYKDQVNFYLVNRFKEDFVMLDNEYRIVGCKSMDYQSQLSTKFSFYLHKKFSHSFLYGSIKFIKV